jgi:ABC-2 type transport system ATP-binding protein
VSAVLFDRVTKRFGARTVLRELSAEFDRGINLLLGPNGSGKTTLLNIAAGIVAPDGGTVTILGTPVARAKGRVFLVPATPPAIPWLTGRDLVSFAASLFATRASGDAVESLVAGFGLAPHFDKPLGDMSSGTARKATLVAAFASGAPVLLLDEPTNELDDASLAFFRELLAQSPDKVILVATHHAEQVGEPASAIRLAPQD